MKLLGLIILLGLSALSTAWADDPVINVDKDDAEVNAAMAKARSEVDKFISILQAGGSSDYSVKVRIADGSKVEYFWLAKLTYANGIFSGTIDNDPEYVKNVKLDQAISVKKEEIADWLYMKNDKMYGNYTLRVFLPRMPKDEADKLRAIMAD